MTDVHIHRWEKVAFGFHSQKWAGLSSAYSMLFSGLWPQLKMGMRPIGSFKVCQVLAETHRSSITLEMCPARGAQTLLSCQGDGGWSEGGAPVIAWDVLDWSQFETEGDVKLGITTCDISILWQTYGCKMGKEMALLWELLLCCSFPQHCKLFTKESLQTLFLCVLSPLTPSWRFPNP